jgi:hypothetical protein
MDSRHFRHVPGKKAGRHQAGRHEQRAEADHDDGEVSQE